MSHQYHRVLPSANNLSGFKENDVIDFLITADPSRALVTGSLALEYQLQVEKTGGTLVTMAFEDEICMKNAACFIDQLRVEVEGKGNIENLMYYNRYCSLVNECSSTINQRFDSLNQCQGIVALRKQQHINVCQLATQTETASAKRDPHYMHVLKCSMNNIVGGEYKFSNGYIKISLNLARANKALYGRYSATNDVQYTLKNVSLRYQSRLADDSNKLPLMMPSYKAIKGNINSQQNVIQALVPSQACSGVIMNFIKQSREQLFRFDSNAGNVLKEGFDSIRFLYNSNLGERVAYDITDLDESQQQAADVLNENGNNNITRRAMGTDDNFVLGMNFKSLINLNNINTQVNINLENTAATSPYNAYLYFTEILQM